MASGKGRGADHLTHHERLIEAPASYHIFLALRVIEAAHADAPRFGTSRRPRQDAVRLDQEPTLAFQKASIEAYTPKGAGPGRLANLFYGLFGPHGPLPPHLTDRETAHDSVGDQSPIRPSACQRYVFRPPVGATTDHHQKTSQYAR